MWGPRAAHASRARPDTALRAIRCSARGSFSTYCGSCHNDDGMGVAARDYHLLANVVKEKVKLACGVSKSATNRAAHACAGTGAGQFPVGAGPKPSDPDRERLVNWIEAGTP